MSELYQSVLKSLPGVFGEGNALDKVLEAADLQIVFIATLLEKFIPILPSYVLLPAIGMGATSGTDLMLRWLVASGGSVGGALGWYMVGSIIGPLRVRRFVLGYGHWIFLPVHLYDKMSSSYRRRPFLITAVGQLIPTVRIYQALPAGVMRLPLLPFLAATAFGAQGWIIVLTSAGYYLRQEGLTATEIGFGLFIALLVIEGSVLFAVHRFYKHRQTSNHDVV